MLVDPKLQPAVETPTTLAVVVHGLSRRTLETVPPVVAQYLPAADILTPIYKAGYLSNADAGAIAREISEAIDQQWRKHKSKTGSEYQRIILIGHSRGALMVRKAYVIACGAAGDLAREGMVPAPKPWRTAVERIILLAGMNRGWSLSPRPTKMPWARWVTFRTLAWFGRLTGQAKLLNDIRQGAPFIANLRVQWIRLGRIQPMPLTVQILGDQDDLVLPSDNIDVQAGKNFIYLNAPPGTTHSTIVELGDPDRRAVFERALLGTDLSSEYTVPAEQEEDRNVERVVFIVHGIRDFGSWTGRLSDKLKELAKGRNLHIETRQSSYGYFPMGRFLLLSERQKNVRWFMDEYTEVLARYPNVERVDFVGHSNGTYLLGSALRNYQASTFGQIVCAGSVLPRNYEWDRMETARRITGVRNYLASQDWVVGIFPNLFDFRGDIGGGGFFGFMREPARRNQFQYVRGGHGAALVDDNFDSIAAFVLDNRLEPPPEKIRQLEPSGIAEFLSKFRWAVWLLLVALVLAAGVYVAFGWPPALIPYWWLRLLLFVALLVAILNSV